MDTEIPTDLDLAMRKHVERAVRPVRTGGAKKLRMREELFCHLTAIYLEELEQCRDPQLALRTAIERFGEPAALTAELNDSLAWIERFDYWDDFVNQKWYERFGKGDDGSWRRFALRWTVGLGLFNLFVVVLLLVVVLVQYRSSGDASGFSGLWKMLVLLTVAEPPAVLGIRCVFIALQQANAARWMVAVGQALAWSFLEALAAIAFWWSMSGSLPTNIQLVGIMESFMIGLPPFLLVGGLLCSIAQRNQKNRLAWALLTIDA